MHGEGGQPVGSQGRGNERWVILAKGSCAAEEEDKGDKRERRREVRSTLVRVRVVQNRIDACDMTG